MSKGLTIFDLDNTLLAGDSDYLWGVFLVEQGLVDREHYERENLRYYEQYQAGTLDIHAFLSFSLRPLAQHDPAALQSLRERFMREKIAPIMLPKARALIENHRQRGHTLLIISATNRFVTGPIAEAYGVSDLLASEPEMKHGRYTGRVAGIPCYREGKVARLEQWLKEKGVAPGEIWFYSDSHNDIPLLEKVTHPVAVDPDAQLMEYAKKKNWPTISLR
ncbi:MAG: HAD-IB family hydrolase [Gammaproteobacteria bacterium]|nr:HAD-IB family hydrolase [Gammaproteobacteria bacterium]